jgi:TetR/AcrR family transcriptional regulator
MTPRAVAQRDAARSRALILDSAESVFAERGYAATTMEQIAMRAGMARASPGYFFSSKAALYEEVLLRVRVTRAKALTSACTPLHAWAGEPAAEVNELRAAVASAVRGYVAFLEDRGTFARLIEWEALSAAERLPAEDQGPISDALRALHRVRRRRRLRDFDVEVVVVALVSMCFLPIAHASTFAAGGGIDPLAQPFRARYERQVVESVLGMIVRLEGLGHR